MLLPFPYFVLNYSRYPNQLFPLWVPQGGCGGSNALVKRVFLQFARVLRGFQASGWKGIQQVKGVGG